MASTSQERRRRLAAFVTLFAMTLAALGGWVYERNSRWHRCAAVIKAAGGTIHTTPMNSRLDVLTGRAERPQGRTAGTTYQLTKVAVTLEPRVVRPETFKAIGELPGLDCLSLDRKQFDPADLAALAQATSLQKLSLHQTSVNDEALEHLKNLRKLEMLGLGRTQITDEGLARLVSLPHLRFLSLHDLPITDSGVEHLCQMRTLAELEIVGTDISQDGMQRLQEALPDCIIIRQYWK